MRQYERFYGLVSLRTRPIKHVKTRTANVRALAFATAYEYVVKPLLVGAALFFKNPARAVIRGFGASIFFVREKKNRELRFVVKPRPIARGAVDCAGQ